MPEDKKDKRSNPKEQRRPRHGRQSQTEKKIEKKPEEPKSAPKVTVPQKPPEYESPGPEFYKNLKRETDEILKITEEENTKYKKKEIQSNWSKYEMPIESYEEIEEQENMGADYEKLIQAPLSIGGHFQFKHEKSWDLNTAPSLYDKYFEINMDTLSLALSTIPFFERNSIDKTIFTETDMLNMNNRAIRFKQKYYNDKSYTTPEMDASVKILNSLKENTTKSDNNKLEEHSNKVDNITESKNAPSQDIVIKNIQDEMQAKAVLENFTKEKRESTPVTAKVGEKPVNIETDDKLEIDKVTRSETVEKSNGRKSDEIKQKILNSKQPQMPIDNNSSIPNKPHITESPDADNTVMDNEVNFDDFVFGKVEKKIAKDPVAASVPVATGPKVPQIPPEPKNPVIESPEDLEKWLDDFLDG